MNIPKQTIEHIISAEINFFNLERNNDIDWFPVVGSYHKALDILIENFITKDFRKFAKKKWESLTRKNDVIEKFLNSIIYLWYSFSIWKFYHIIKKIKNDEELLYYWQIFSEFLDKYHHIKDIIMDDYFYKKLWKIVNSEVLWEKRHKGLINLKEATESRKILIWDFSDRTCLIHRLIEIQNIPY
jgi:hypothetical protein